MAKSSKYKAKRNKQGNPEVRPPEALNPKQQEYIKALKTCSAVTALGPPGTSKTYLPSALGAYWLHTGDIDRVVIARSPDGPGVKTGHLPGSFEDKVGEYMRPVVNAMTSVISKVKFEQYQRNGQVEFCQLPAIKGRTFHRTMLIIDEAEDIDVATMKAIVTRIGEDSILVINGDIQQQNLRGKSGLTLAIDIASTVDFNWPIIEFDTTEIVRSDFCRQVTEALIKLGHY